MSADSNSQTHAPDGKLVLPIMGLLIVALWNLGGCYGSRSADDAPVAFKTDPSFRGELGVWIIERKTGPQRNLLFLIDLDAGKTISYTDRQPDYGTSTEGAYLGYSDCKKMKEITSPDGQSTAYCKVAGEDYTLMISSAPKMYTPGPEWGITGLAWLSDSKSVAVLLERERTALDPASLFALLSGHPIPLATFKVVLLSSDLKVAKELPVIRKDSPSGWAQIERVR
jgi:hypothetical protein